MCHWLRDVILSSNELRTNKTVNRFSTEASLFIEQCWILFAVMTQVSVLQGLFLLCTTTSVNQFEIYNKYKGLSFLPKIILGFMKNFVKLVFKIEKQLQNKW